MSSVSSPAPSPASFDVLIAGAGLSGLVAAEHLTRGGHSVGVLEARSRIGGRCWSPALAPGGTACDLGAAWHWDGDVRVKHLADRLGLDRIRQHEPSNSGPPFALKETSRDAPVERIPWSVLPPPSWRIGGGVQRLHEELDARLPADAIHLRHRVTQCARTSEGVRLQAESPDGLHTFTAGAAILALPPRLLALTVDFDPPLPPSLHQTLAETPTWMSHSGKAAVTYPTPFWRRRDLAGRVHSTVGPVHDWHDAVPPDDDAAGVLVGFLHPPGPGSPTPEGEAERRKAIVEQLVHCFGTAAAEPVDVLTHVWRDDDATTPPGDGSRSVPGHPPQPVDGLQAAQWGGRLHWGAAETATERPGYLDGAIEAGLRTATRIQQWTGCP